MPSGGLLQSGRDGGCDRPGPGEVAQLQTRTPGGDLPYEGAHTDSLRWTWDARQQPVRVDVETAQLDLLHLVPADEVNHGVDLVGGVRDARKSQQVDRHLAAAAGYHVGALGDLLEAISNRAVVGAEVGVVQAE